MTGQDDNIPSGNIVEARKIAIQFKERKSAKSARSCLKSKDLDKSSKQRKEKKTRMNLK